MLIYIKNIFSKINISEKTIPPNNKPKTSKNHIVPDYYINLGKQFYIKGWNNFNIWQRKMNRHVGDVIYPYIKGIWKHIHLNYCNAPQKARNNFGQKCREKLNGIFIC